MIRRLLSLVILVAIVLACLYFWRVRGGGPSLAGFTSGKLGESLSGVGQDIQNAKLKASIKTALELNRSLRPFSIGVDVNASKAVKLQGEVASDELKAAAEQVAAAVPDVESVENRLVVNPTLLPPAAGRTMGEVLDDRALEAQTHVAFSLNRHLKGTSLSVHAHRRDVEVKGEIEREEQRPIALEIVRNVPGVSSVVDQIALRGPSASSNVTPPGDKARAVAQALAANPQLAGYSLHVTERGAQLVLSGRVNTAVEKELAGFVAKDAAGGPVENGLIVEPSPPTS